MKTKILCALVVLAFIGLVVLSYNQSKRIAEREALIESLYSEIEDKDEIIEELEEDCDNDSDDSDDEDYFDYD